MTLGHGVTRCHKFNTEDDDDDDNDNDNDNDDNDNDDNDDATRRDGDFEE